MFLKGNWKTDAFVTNYLPLVLFPLFYGGARLYFRVSPVKPEDMDFVTGIAEIEEGSSAERTPRNWLQRIWSWLVRLTYPLAILVLMAL